MSTVNVFHPGAPGGDVSTIRQGGRRKRCSCRPQCDRQTLFLPVLQSAYFKMTARETIYSWLQVPLAVELLLSRQRDEKETLFSINNSEPHKYCSSPTYSSFCDRSLLTSTKFLAGQSFLCLPTISESCNCPGMEWMVMLRGPERGWGAVLWCILWCCTITRTILHSKNVILTWDHPSFTLLPNVAVSFSLPAQGERGSQTFGDVLWT